jgi:hypothetical protein
MLEKNSCCDVDAIGPEHNSNIINIILTGFSISLGYLVAVAYLEDDTIRHGLFYDRPHCTGL